MTVHPVLIALALLAFVVVSTLLLRRHDHSAHLEASAYMRGYFDASRNSPVAPSETRARAAHPSAGVPAHMSNVGEGSHLAPVIQLRRQSTTDPAA